MATAATTRRPSGPVLSAAHYRSASPARVKLAGGNASRPAGPSVSVSSSSSASGGVRSRRSCMCSPTNHPGSFRCSLHKERKSPPSPPSPGSSGSAPTSSRLGAAASRRMGSALVRIGAVEGGEWARRALAATVRPSPAAQQSQHRRRVGGFRPRPSRLSAVSMAGDRAGDNNEQ
ncbi:hypothetical protein PR202_gb10049 [Eleusine coracana subsp. coracana]|uniref:Serine-rich protein-like protein n=1 Tax=Eleusine coracana subsp. coracana TaxID=191504 RepID=A0AAV5EGI2_ELECO|nr:hypothetical protein QOZ80_2BG0204870 [Eleusine coracana subsp. coracana]GJN22484.1 hypothetical protein PR202_gb10049 [Eleusine coracana subsp. coracana]